MPLQWSVNLKHLLAIFNKETNKIAHHNEKLYAGTVKKCRSNRLTTAWNPRTSVTCQHSNHPHSYLIPHKWASTFLPCLLRKRKCDCSMAFGWFVSTKPRIRAIRQLFTSSINQVGSKKGKPSNATEKKACIMNRVGDHLDLLLQFFIRVKNTTWKWENFLSTTFN